MLRVNWIIKLTKDKNMCPFYKMITNLPLVGHVDYLNGKENTTSDNDYITGTWRGKTVSIKSSWNGHIWTEEEVRNLFAGREISVYGFKSKKGSTYGVTGKLENQFYNGKKFFGFMRTGFAD